MSRITGKIRAIWKRLADPDYRDSFVASKVANDIAFQVFHLREHRGWTQGELAHRAETMQPSISRLERSIGSVNVGTLLKVARAFNVGLSIRFVPFNKLVGEAVGAEISNKIPSFEEDYPPLGSAPIIRVSGTPDVAAIHAGGASLDEEQIFQWGALPTDERETRYVQ